MLVSGKVRDQDLQTSALLMNCSVAAFSFSLCPLHALRADACRARPKEKVRIQGLARGQLLMALRWTEASSSLWPPERKATPVCEQKNLVLLSFYCCRLQTHFCKIVSRQDSVRGGSPVTAGGTVRRKVVTVAIATSSGLYLVRQLCPAVTMLGLRRVPSRYTWWSDMALYTALRICNTHIVSAEGQPAGASLPLLK